jgi:hypothetical protein
MPGKKPAARSDKFTKPQVGEHIVFAKYGGIEIKGRDGKQYRLMNDEDVLGASREGRMASAALKMEPDDRASNIPGEGGDRNVNAIRRARFDAEARSTPRRSRGWAPEEEFKGDKARWVDAKTFVSAPTR